MLSDIKPPENAIDFIAIGSIHFLGLFIMLDALTGFVFWLESFVKLAIWAVVATIPVLVFAYVLGLLSIVVAEMVFLRTTRASDNSDLDQLFNIAIAENNLLTQRFLETMRFRKLLLGISPAFLVVAISLILQIRRQPADLQQAFYLIAAGLMVLVIVCPIFAYFINKQATEISKKSVFLQKKKNDSSSKRKDGF
jgi:hypothetical protein